MPLAIVYLNWIVLVAVGFCAKIVSFGIQGNLAETPSPEVRTKLLNEAGILDNTALVIALVVIASVVYADFKNQLKLKKSWPVLLSACLLLVYRFLVI